MIFLSQKTRFLSWFKSKHNKKQLNLKKNCKNILVHDNKNICTPKKQKEINIASDCNRKNNSLNTSHLDNNANLELTKKTIDYKPSLLNKYIINKNSIVTKDCYVEKKSFFSKLKLKLQNTRKNINFRIKNLFFKKDNNEQLLQSIADHLIMADVGVTTTDYIVQNIKKDIHSKKLLHYEDINIALKKIMLKILKSVERPLEIKDTFPFVILVVGSNGVGKTTTIGKLAKKYKNEGKSVLLAAGDTFRAGAVEQLIFWGKTNNIPIITQHYGADPAAVIFDAVQSAQSKNIDVLIADTAGRLQNKLYLMEELKKIVRVMKKLDHSYPHEIMLVIDASSGQNVMQQIKLFHKALGPTGLILTKLDGTAKGGIIFSIANQFKLPIRYIGIGERIDDLGIFNSVDFIDALFLKGMFL
ncbi:signal recognition particle-docking protein FtsY [Buchnera aphidicola (Hormaphis cornu)]|nr:signal recognition particle-docking protein FtsY [Buchnera aphidicola (Hormaphis cornu)]